MTTLPISHRPDTPSTSNVALLKKQTIARLLIQCPDRTGIVSAVSSILSDFGANIVSLDQHSTDPTGGVFFQRTEFHLEHFGARRAELEEQIQAKIEAPYTAEWQLTSANTVANAIARLLTAWRSPACVPDITAFLPQSLRERGINTGPRRTSSSRPR